MRFLGYALGFLLGLPTGIAAIAVHHSAVGLVLGVATTLVVSWTLHLWLAGTAMAFSVGWLVPLVFAVAGRPEGDVAVASDGYGWSLIASGFVVLVTGILWGRARGSRMVQNVTEPPPRMLRRD